ncbi:MAG: hypothetical protein MJ189_05750, partial [Coriobacteriales bacterium]|nr:hypothetical protein [Coriobacteriales bacterium]
MDKLFLCLANSYKHDNRCLAGVEVISNKGSFSLVTDSWGHPKWFRPIHRLTNAGAIPNQEAVNIKCFDVIRATEVEACPDGAQSENYFYNVLIIVGTWAPTSELLSQLSRTHRKVILGNLDAFVSHNHYNRMDYSIMMIDANQVQCYLKDRENKPPQPRMVFVYKDTKYDFPVTDPSFRHEIENNLSEVNKNTRYYLTLSLGAICDDKHFKLVASVFVPCKQITRQLSQSNDEQKSEWKVVEIRNFTIEEINAVDKAVVVASDYGNSICFYMKSGGMTFIPQYWVAKQGVGETVDMNTAK